MLIGARHISDLLDVRSFRGANINSDNYLVRAKIRAGISQSRKSKNKRE